MIYAISILVFASAAALIFGLVPALVRRSENATSVSNAKFIQQYDVVLSEEQIKTTQKMLLFAPLVLGSIGFFFGPADMQWAGALCGAAIGYAVPRIRLSGLLEARKRKFNDQLTDALMIMSSSFRGGLSLIQAIEAVVEEMPDPIRQEFGIVLGENKMGVPLDESLERLYLRMPSPAMQQTVTAILLARETGGNLALIFSRIISSTRERRKIENNLKTLTIQGKIQAAVMTGLPVLFYLGVSASNPHFFDNMKSSPTGQQMLAACAVLWVVGALSIWKISTFKDI